jgi:hypothetical protein
VVKSNQRVIGMLDLVLVVLGFGLFLSGVAYIYGCAKI